MGLEPEQLAREKIDQLLTTAGWAVQSVEKANIHAARAALADYEGNPVEERLVKECVEAAERLLADVRAWLKKYRPDLT